jgi:iron complex outermembrane receptor protein
MRRLLNATSVIALVSTALAIPGAAASAQTAPAGTTAAPGNGGLEEIIVTAQKREANVQNVPMSISALSGATIQKDKIRTLGDLASTVTGISFTANSPQSNEINIRGVVNTRLSSPTADQSVSTFVDDVYVGRSGNLNSAFYDVARIEILRGPQGVLLGKNVAGGAINVISAPATETTSGHFTASY